ncbi:outer membrane protein TolC [Elusimicrobium posterum]|uniref:TolC family protein n=1 Tax=Elusimicrobium posterum TaxID=3116653 RepID=UPI003C714B1D
MSPLKKKIVNKIFLLSVLLFFPLCSFSASVSVANGAFTLDSYILSYLQNSPDLVKEQNSFLASKIEFQNSVIDLFLPSAGFDAGTTLMSKENPGFKFDNSYDSSLYIDWNIFNSGRDYLAYRQKKNTLEAAEIRFKNKLQNTVFDAIKVFYDLKLKESLLEVAKSDIADKEEQFEMTGFLYQDGLRAYSDLLQSENNYKNSQLRLVQQTADYTSAKIAFNNKINRDINAAVTLDYELGDLPPLYATDYAQDFAAALQYREDINTEILSLHNKKIADKLTKMNNLPMLSAGFSFNNSSYDIFGKNSNRTEYALGLKLSVPIGFLWVDKYNETRISKLELVNSYMDFEEVLRNIRIEVSGARTELMLQHAGIEISENNLKIAKERLDITREKYKDGESSALDLSQAQDEYLSAQINDTTYKYNYNLNQYSYKRTLGLDVYDASSIVFDNGDFAQKRTDVIDKDFLKQSRGKK